jgi:hypothetical protein
MNLQSLAYGQYIPFLPLFKAAIGTFCNDFDIFVTTKSSDTAILAYAICKRVSCSVPALLKLRL